MKIIFFSHPDFLHSQSMPRFTEMLATGMKARGHEVEIWKPEPILSKRKGPKSTKKWLGYIDQYFFFPRQVRKKLKTISASTLFVFSDHALGPWVPLVNDRPHVIHCHDFLAQKSAKGELPENRTGFTGRIYQSYIRRGYRRGKNFISISIQTKKDLTRFLTSTPLLSEVVYNGLNRTFEKIDPAIARESAGHQIELDLTDGFILHVGGNQWYKNRTGLIEIYNAFRSSAKIRIPLLLVGSTPSRELMQVFEQSPFKNEIFFLSAIQDELLGVLYAGASTLLFPSLAEGFGWPIAEAMAAGIPVITTNEAPMTEVGGDAAFYISRKPMENPAQSEWAAAASKKLLEVLDLTPDHRKRIQEAGFKNVERFSIEVAMNNIELIYKSVNNQ